MRHVTDTFNDMQSVGIEYIREIYRNSGLSIRPQTKINKIEPLKGVIMALGLDPNEVLSREAMVKPHRTIIGPSARQEQDYVILQKTIKKTLLEELRNSTYLSCDSGSPGEIRTPV
ncbi:MAG: hypothetical protein NWE89_04315 [Candidatus Bathyarchaeota archaeon]|nr:hypothetical protein [Candidatus Bathyarchaeota archaeon]